ncbi:hypothetical protein HF984_10370 [Rothia terrae]|uniref:hypothetical protein n=1 Tax=Rothia terrae TaxID=396015 RepID=UPI00144526D5|nr:hypothetical protein [Rothia terrae]MDT0189416.1 hypothetical protein [Rothia terrae]NKZ35148.1 hypothetical protein [Rothia terrae]
MAIAICLVVSSQPTALASELNQEVYGYSLNGWPIHNPADDVSTVEKCDISGISSSCEMRIWDVNIVLSDLVCQMHYRVKDIRLGEISGWKDMTEAAIQTPYSNLSSGTALQIRPSMPLDSCFAYEIQIIEEVLKDYEGVVFWGGVMDKKDESLFYINTSPNDPLFIKVAEKVRV